MEIINISELTEEKKQNFLQKIEFENLSSVTDIIKDVRKNGDEALKRYSKQFGDGEIDTIELTEDEIQNAISKVDKKTIDTLNFAIENVKEFAEKQLSCIKELETQIAGSTLGHKIVPLESVGCYIPGGNYPLPSTAIMTITPAKVAGVKNIIAVSPKIKPVTIAACKLAGATKIFKVGGVQAVAGLAYGTETLPKVNKIVGPGNKYVTSAKKQVFGECGIDFLAGPSEVLIIADEKANPKFVAADMLAQCEHDKDARAYLICFSADFATKVKEEAEAFLNELETAEIAKISFAKSIAIVVNSIGEAVELSEERAPEHLELCFENATDTIEKFKNYGSMFIGNYSAEVFGDYVSGTNHTLPTNQVAKYSGGLSVFDYIKIQTYQIISKTAINQIAANASNLAKNEGLFAHKLAADVRKH
ncbi:MAG: histidinol dehydrogenase [Candidatus Gastranaerophilales bacterium]|nr:histidinol dehydrogenase [Candidatus Gastranaerophilales bacterium]